MKKNNVYKILIIAIIASIIISYLVPGTSISYGSVTKGTIAPVTFADSFINTLTSFSAFMTLFVYVLSIGVFYAILNKTGKFDTIVNNIACMFKKRRTLFIALTAFVYALLTMFTGELYSTLVFLPLSISIIRKLGYRKETSILTTVGSILIGGAGSLYTYHIIQMLSVTLKDTLLQRIILVAVALVFLVAFVLIFDKKPEPVELEKKKEKKLVPIYVSLGLILVLFILGFVNWEGYFGFKGFSTFLENIRDFKLFKVSVFDSIIGSSSSIVAFGTWQVYHGAILITFIAFIIGLINRIKIRELFSAAFEGLKEAFTYGLIVVLANVVLVNIFTSGAFYTIVMGITKNAVDMSTGTLSSVIAAIAYPDYSYATQFTLTSILNSSASGYESLISVLYQAVYCVTLLVSPTSILLLLALRYTETKYTEWIKYIFKFFVVFAITVSVVLTLLLKPIDAVSIVALILLIIAIGIIIYKKIISNKLGVENKTTEKVETKKEEVKEVKVEKKEETKKNNSKKSTNKKSNNKKKK